MSERSANAAGQYLGYQLQLTRLLFYLLKAQKGDVLSLEVIDDVAIEHNNQHVTAEQQKSITSSRNPISDKAVDLWKTLSNWVDDVTSGRLKPKSTKFILYISELKKGEIANAFHNANSVQEVKQAINSARTQIYKNGGSRSSETLSKYIENFFNNNNAAEAVVQNFILEMGSGSPQNDLRNLIENSPGIPHRITSYVKDAALGWLKSYTDSTLEKSECAYVPYDEFRLAFDAYVQRFSRDDTLPAFSEKSKIDLNNFLEKNFVKQMDIIDLDNDEIIDSIDCFLRAKTEQMIWGEQGLVTKESFVELEDSLIKKWRNAKRSAKLAGESKSDVWVGQHIYTDCNGHSANIEGKSVPDFFIPGSFQDLSNNMTLGWHPEYKSIMNKKSDENEK